MKKDVEMIKEDMLKVFDKLDDLEQATINLKHLLKKKIYRDFEGVLKIDEGRKRE